MKEEGWYVKSFFSGNKSWRYGLFGLEREFNRFTVVYGDFVRGRLDGTIVKMICSFKHTMTVEEFETNVF